MTNDTRDRSDRDVMAPARRPMILVIDDQPQILALYSRALSSAGYQTEVAGSAEAALAQIRKTPPDAILVDLKMPYINGMGMLYRLRQQYPGMPVAIMTGGENPDNDTLKEMRGSFLQLASVKADLSAKYGPEHPRIKIVEAQMEALRTRIVGRPR